jgi:hypothetical protein
MPAKTVGRVDPRIAFTLACRDRIRSTRVGGIAGLSLHQGRPADFDGLTPLLFPLDITLSRCRYAGFNQ